MFINLPIKILRKLKAHKAKRRVPYNRLIDVFSKEFVSEVIWPKLQVETVEQFRELEESRLWAWKDARSKFRISFDTPSSERLPLETNFSPECLKRIELIEAAFDCYRQNAFELVLSYGLRIPGKSNPSKGEIRRAIHELLVMKPDFQIVELRAIVDAEL